MNSWVYGREGICVTYFKDSLLNFKNGNIECSTSQVIHCNTAENSDTRSKTQHKRVNMHTQTSLSLPFSSHHRPACPSPSHNTGQPVPPLLLTTQTSLSLPYSSSHHRPACPSPSPHITDQPVPPLFLTSYPLPCPAQMTALQQLVH